VIVERESSLEERERKDAEKAAEIKDRQVRLGHVPAEPEEKDDKDEKEEKPNAKPKPRKPTKKKG
jgi:hypothetical protein